MRAASLAADLSTMRADLARGNLAAVDAQLDALAADLPDDFPEGLRSALARMLTARERWAAAEHVTVSALERTPAIDRLQTWARNMAALQEHRPSVYAQLVGEPPATRWVVDDFRRVGQIIDGTFRPINADPRQWIDEALPVIEAMLAEGTFGLGGVGDGYGLWLLANIRIQNPTGRETPTVIIEPDIDLLRAVLEAHDLSGELGPIVDPRFFWLVGDGWFEQARDLFFTRASLLIPKRFLNCGAHPQVGQGLNTISEEITTEILAIVDRLRAHYDGVPSATLAAAFRSHAEASPSSRAPRALFLTSRFTTVLQHSTRDAAEALEALGWDTQVLIEEFAYTRVTLATILRALDAMRPDLMFMIDHFRREYKALPPSLPFVTWLQDCLPLAESHKTGSSLGERDFVMTGFAALTRHYGYPQAQVFPCRCFAFERKVEHTGEATSHDVVYLSHASMSVDDLRARAEVWAIHHRVPKAKALDLLEGVIARYAAGGSFASTAALDAWQRTELGIDPLDDAQAHKWMSALTFAYCTLHRQQGLRWAAELAEQRGLDLGIYGNGWDAHPSFAPHARGPVAKGAQAAALQQRAGFVLVLEPWPVTAHWRGLEAMLQRTLPLVREHPWTHMPATLRRFLDQHGLAGCESVAQARATIDPGLLRPLDEHLRHFSHLGVTGDPLAYLLREPAACVPPAIETVSFSSKATLADRLERFASGDDDRASVIEQLYHYTKTHFTYEAGFARMLEFVADAMDERHSESAVGS